MTMLSRVAVFAAAITLLAAPRLDAQSGTIRVTIGNGPRAGTYEMAESCLIQPDAYPSLHIMGFATGAADPKLPRTMEFFTASTKGKPDGFVVSVSFATGQDPYQIFTIPFGKAPGAPVPTGSGTVTVKQSATGTTATFKGTTKDGVRLEGTVECGSPA